MNRRVLAGLAALVITATSTLPASAQFTVFDPSMFTVQVAQKAQEATNWITQLQQNLNLFQNAQSQLTQAEADARSIPQQQWQRLMAQFNTVTEAEQFITVQPGQQQQILRGFHQFYPMYTSGQSFDRLNQILANKTAGAAEQARREAEQDRLSLPDEKRNLDNIMANASATTQQQKLQLELTLARQTIEQLQKLRALMGTEIASMQATEAAHTSVQSAHVQKHCEERVQYVFRQVHQQNPNVTIDQVRTAVYQNEGNDEYGNQICVAPPNA